MPILKTVDLEDSEFVLDRLPNSENARFGKFGKPAEPSAPTSVMFGRLWRDPLFHFSFGQDEPAA